MKRRNPVLQVMEATDFDKVKDTLEDMLDPRLLRSFTVDRIRVRVKSMLLQACAEERSVEYLCLRVVYKRTNIGYHLQLEVWKPFAEMFFRD